MPRIIKLIKTVCQGVNPSRKPLASAILYYREPPELLYYTTNSIDIYRRILRLGPESLSKIHQLRESLDHHVCFQLTSTVICRLERYSSV